MSRVEQLTIVLAAVLILIVIAINFHGGSITAPTATRLSAPPSHLTVEDTRDRR
jgi:hypothetical protein